MRLSPSLIKVGKRVRRDIDKNIHSLERSIRDLGQLQPILVDEDNNLIAGARRLRVCELLEIDVIAVVPDSLDDAIKRLKAERDENQCREGFTPEEIAVTRGWLRSKGNSIEGGTTEINLNVVAKRVLGLRDTQ